MKKLIGILMAVLFNCVAGGALSAAVGVNPMFGALGLNIIGLVSTGIPAGALPAGVFQEVWTREVVKQFSVAETATFLEGVPDFSQYAENDVIHLADAGVDPDVLINNTTYPIPLQTLSESDVSVSLDKYQTKATPVTDDELYAVTYDKIALRKEQHGNAIANAKHKKAIHAYAPASNTTNTPVLATTGEQLSDGRKRLTRADIIAMKKRLDIIGVPEKGRRLVLCPDHIEDLLLTDQKFADQYYNYTSGKISNLYGFEVYEFAANPLFTAAGVKKSYGAVADTGEYQASVVFYTGNVFKCKGSTKMYFSEAKTDPQNQRNLVNFRHYFLAMPKVQRGIGAIVSGYAAAAPAPTISGAENVSITAAGTAVNRTYATSNGAGVTAETDADWLTLTVTGNKVNFAATAFAYDAEGTSPRTASVTIGIIGTNVTKTVTVSQDMAAQE